MPNSSLKENGIADVRAFLETAMPDAQLTAVAAGDFWTDFAGAFVRGEAGGGEGPSDSGTN